MISTQFHEKFLGDETRILFFNFFLIYFLICFFLIYLHAIKHYFTSDYSGFSSSLFSSSLQDNFRMNLWRRFHFICNDG